MHEHASGKHGHARVAQVASALAYYVTIFTLSSFKVHTKCKLLWPMLYSYDPIYRTDANLPWLIE
ncbi:hypothetical protein DEO72_LG4g1565 [Vigna unguiculata]|uniref:Uncharacterized protein n=1 Tax=Vigna unguiculata TaxID=3917 RepID=A0A4D6LQD2_VIGUN|nr:hypothetical protein DEO72_LG4g1565 [Vigna unguiculata]